MICMVKLDMKATIQNFGLPFFVLSLFFLICLSDSAKLPIDLVHLPDGFEISIYADNVTNARSMTLSPNGILFVGTRQTGNVYAIPDTNQDYQADEVIVIARNLNMPNGVAFRNGNLYVAEVNRVLRYDEIENRLRNPPNPVVVNDEFPTDLHHGWKFIRFGPDNRLYVPVGAPCNVCERKDQRYASIMRMQPDGSGLEIFARGVRNTVGFDWHPETKELWFTDNGRDMLGNNIPPDELNYAPQEGLHFGFPYLHGKNILDPEFGGKRDLDDLVQPAMELGPHVAALGMRFYSGTMFPAEYKGQIFIAEHGSWNRTIPIGYRITLVRLEEGKAVSYEVFADGWLREDGSRWGRPVDLLIMPDGSMLVSDDYGNAVYRITSTNLNKVELENRKPVLLGQIKQTESTIFQNYPNPFNPETWIPYYINCRSNANITIYRMDGTMITQIYLGIRESGFYVTPGGAAFWNGRDANGDLLSSGIYFYRLEVNNRSQVKQMVLLK